MLRASILHPIHLFQKPFELNNNELMKEMVKTRYTLNNLWLVICLVFCSPLIGQEQFIPLYPEGIPCENSLEMETVERESIGRVISKVHTPEMLIYKADPQANGSAVVICPGGGYTILAWDWEGTLMAEWFQKMGVTAFVLRYRLPHWESIECRGEVALMDAQRAMRTVRLHAASYGLDPEKIGVMGFSAGGHLASTLSTHFDDGDEDSELPVERYSCRPNFSILMYPVVTMDTSVAHSGSRKNLMGENPSKEREHYFSNEKQVTSETPPTILIHANDDEAVIPENSIQYYLALRKHEVPAALHIYESGGHGFSFGYDKGSVGGWADVCQSWMKNLGLVGNN